MQAIKFSYTRYPMAIYFERACMPVSRRADQKIVSAGNILPLFFHAHANCQYMNENAVVLP